MQAASDYNHGDILTVRRRGMNIASVFQGIAAAAWIAFIAMVGMALVRGSRGQPARGLNSLTIALLIAAIVLTSVGAGMVFLQADEYGVVISAFQPRGYRAQPLGPGLHWIVPFLENVRTYSIARQTYTMSIAPGEGPRAGDDSIDARTKDGQQVLVDGSVIYSVDPAHIIDLHITWQSRYEENVVRPVARAAIRQAVSQYGIEEIVTSRRVDLEQAVTDAIAEGLRTNNLILTDFLLRNIAFGEEYSKAVEQKQIAEQQAQQAFYVVEQRKQEAEQARQAAQGQADAAVIAAKGAADARLIQAEAEARANQLLAQSLSPQLLQYQYILKLSPGVQTIFVPSGNQFILPLPSVTGQ
jgi:regulator of protease activity HflC (stomatin/prohibitin superfamily)